jgi:hypothetical protein
MADEKDNLLDEQVWQPIISGYRNDPARAVAQALVEAAKIAPIIYDEQIKKTYGKDKEQDLARVNVFLEFLGLYCHIMHREAFEYIEHAEIDELLKHMNPLTTEYALAALEEYAPYVERGTLVKGIVQDMNKTEAYYSKYPALVGKDSQDENAILPQVKYRIMDVFNIEDTFMPRFEQMALAANAYGYFLNFIRLREWVKGPIAQFGLKNFDKIQLFPE